MDIDQIISKYLKGESSLDEQHKLTKWMEESKANQQAFIAIKKYYSSYSSGYESEKEEVEKKILNKISQSGTYTKSGSTKLRLLAAAASVIILVLSGITFLDQGGHREMSIKPIEAQAFIEKASLPGQKITTKLPDGTVVHLNSGSRLMVPEKFAADSREVEFVGEAFFDVRPDPERPFVIKTGGFAVRVKGTSFNIKAYPHSKDQSVSVKTGLVSVKSSSDKSVELNPDQMVSIQEDGSISEITGVDDLLVYGWMDHVLVFQDKALSEVFEEMSLWFGVEFVFDEKLVPQKLFTASFDNPTLKEMMINVSRVYGFNYVIKDEKVLIEEIDK